ncbi:hypothetical protein B0H34DRAFT_621802, partial [Crassisporium funariophilum]
GPAIPQRNQDAVCAKYSRLMLILFKPWRHASDLRAHNQSWKEAFDLFCQHCSTNVINKMDNMQIIHECRESSVD